MTTLEITDFKAVLPDSLKDGGPASPCADTDELAALGRRVMVHRNCKNGQFSLFVAESGVVTCGWVLAVEKK